MVNLIKQRGVTKLSHFQNAPFKNQVRRRFQLLVFDILVWYALFTFALCSSDALTLFIKCSNRVCRKYGILVLLVGENKTQQISNSKTKKS